MRIHIGNLSKEITDAELNALGGKFGTVAASNVVRERGGESRGFAFLEFASADEAQAAITGLNGMELGGQALKVSQARNRISADPLGGRF